MPKRIRKIEYDRIDRVPAGAQPNAKIPLVKRRKVAKMIDPASIDARVQQVRDGFREQYSPDDYGCCSPCSGYVYVDAVYDKFVIACDSDGTYWQFGYTQDASGAVTFDDPEAVKPSVKWSVESTEDDPAPVPVMKQKPLWSAPVAERIQRQMSRVTKEQDVPIPKKVTKAVSEDLDLSALDEDTRTAIEAALADNDALNAAKVEFDAAVAAAGETDEPVVELDDDDESLDSIEGLQKAIKKTRSPETKRILKATLSRLEKAEDRASKSEERTARLEKAERVRIFKSRAQAVQHIAAHAGGVDELAGLLETIDADCGSDACEAVEAMLTKAQTQYVEAVKPLLKSIGKAGGDTAGFAQILGTTDDVEQNVNDLAAELQKEKPELTNAQARTRVLKAHPELYAQASAQG